MSKPSRGRLGTCGRVGRSAAGVVSTQPFAGAHVLAGPACKKGDDSSRCPMNKPLGCASTDITPPTGSRIMPPRPRDIRPIRCFHSGLTNGHQNRDYEHSDQSRHKFLRSPLRSSNTSHRDQRANDSKTRTVHNVLRNEGLVCHRNNQPYDEHGCHDYRTRNRDPRDRRHDEHKADDEDNDLWEMPLPQFLG